MSIETNYPELLEWLRRYYPVEANMWITERIEHRLAAPDLREWLSIVFPGLLAEFRARTPAALPEIALEDLEKVDATLIALHAIIARHDEILAEIEVILEGMAKTQKQAQEILLKSGLT